MKKTILFLSILFFIPSLSAATADAATWYRELTAQRRTTHAGGEAIIAGLCAAIAGTWAANKDFRVPDLAGESPFLLAQKKMMGGELKTRSVDWWAHISPTIRGLLIGGLTYGVVRYFYRGLRVRLRRMMPQVRSEKEFISFVQQWPRQQDKVLPELHPILDRLHVQISSQGALSWLNVCALRNGVAAIGAQVQQNRAARGVIGIDESLEFPYPQHRLWSVWGMRVIMLLSDMCVPLLCGLWAGNAWYKKQEWSSLVLPGIILASYNVLRFMVGWLSRKRVHSVMREQLYALITHCGKNHEHFSEQLQAVLVPLYQQYEQTGKLPTYSDRQVEELMAVVCAAASEQTEGEQLVKDLLGTPRVRGVRLLKQMMTPAALIVPIIPGLVAAVFYGAKKDESKPDQKLSNNGLCIGVYTGGLALMLGLRVYNLLKRKQRQRRERVEHLVAHWPTYENRIPERMREIGSALHDEFITGRQRPLAKGEIDLIYERFG